MRYLYIVSFTLSMYYSKSIARQSADTVALLTRPCDILQDRVGDLLTFPRWRTWLGSGFMVLVLRRWCYRVWRTKPEKDSHAAPCRSIVAGTDSENGTKAVAHKR